GGSVDVRHAGNITDNDIGIQCIEGAYAVVESTEVQLNGVGIQVKDSSDADLGNASGGQSVGYNKIHHNSSYHVDNQNGSVTIKAENEWWRGVAPSASKFQGNVDRNPYLTTEPDLDPGSPLLPERGIPTLFHLSGPVPNPFNPTTTISYDVPAPGAEVRLRVYDVRGRLVRDLVSEFKQAGRYSAVWDGVDRNGNGVASGVYFAQMRAGGFVMARKLVLLK
ncbi:MAG TPA: FlgD immunoglobulin-like domain containing protein, partial [Candidatus Krumholzibacteria bacterium]|nr:FlgD immunoglobulin-like domain containing protein [Candidatus Krumholzibacteria bacterium]